MSGALVAPFSNGNEPPSEINTTSCTSGALVAPFSKGNQPPSPGRATRRPGQPPPGERQPTCHECGGRVRPVTGRGTRVAAAVLVATLALVGCSSDGGSEAKPSATTTATNATTTAPKATTTLPEASSVDLVAAACAGTLRAAPSKPITEPLLKEASGVAPTTGRTWVNNDSGDEARLYGIGTDGSVQVVAVSGAKAQDWEDLAVVSGGADPHLWVADTGDNAKARPSVQLYRLPIPAEGATTVAAEAWTVTYPDGAHDVEAVFADAQGSSLYALTKFEVPSKVFRIDPPEGGGAVEAVSVGTFPAGEDGKGIVTGAAFAPDRRAIAVRTYDSAWLYPVADGQAPEAALADEGARCKAPAGAESQGEAIGFLADDTGYVTVGEGAEPVLTTFTP